MRFHPSSGPHVDAAIRDLTSPSVTVRREAASALGQTTTRRPEVISALGDALADPDDEVRFAAALALGTLGDANAFDALLTLLHDPAPLPRQGAAVALGDLGDARAFSALVSAMNDPVADVRFQLPASLLRVAPDRATAPLLILLRDEDAEIRASAASALGDLYTAEDGPQAALDAPPREELIDALVEHLDDAAPIVSLDAAIALARLGDPRGTTALLSHLQNRDGALLAAAQLFERPPAQAQEDFARHARRLFVEPAVRVYLLGALARLGDPQGHEGLEKAIFGRNMIACGLAIELCGRIPKTWARDLLTTFRRHRRGQRWGDEIDDALATHNRASGMTRPQNAKPTPGLTP